MAAVMGVSVEEAAAIAAEAAGDDLVCVAANDNAVGQVVLSGHEAAIDRALEIAKSQRKRAVALDVSAPFHCPLMQPAAERMKEALDVIELEAPRPPLVANVTAAIVDDPAQIKRLLVEQVTGMVRWRESILYMKENGVTETVELGAGKVLSGLTKRIDRGMDARAVGTPEDVEAALKEL